MTNLSSESVFGATRKEYILNPSSRAKFDLAKEGEVADAVIAARKVLAIQSLIEQQLKAQEINAHVVPIEFLMVSTEQHDAWHCLVEMEEQPGAVLSHYFRKSFEASLGERNKAISFASTDGEINVLVYMIDRFKADEYDSGLPITYYDEEGFSILNSFLLLNKEPLTEESALKIQDALGDTFKPTGVIYQGLRLFAEE